MPSVRVVLETIPFLISALALLVCQLARAPTSLKPRVFVIGLSKTGTTSIGDALEMIGYRRLGWQDIRSRHMVHTWANGDLGPLIELTRHYEAFEDLPWPLVYKEMAQLYPDAKFILSLRQDDDTWMRSMERHVGRGQWKPYTYFYGADTFPGNEDVIRASYQNHTASVRDFFRNQPHRYVEMNIDDGDLNWRILCDLIGQCPPHSAIAFPRANTAASWDIGAIGNQAQWYWGWLVTRLEEQCAFQYYERKSSVLRPVLTFLWTLCDVTELAYTEVHYSIQPWLRTSRARAL